MMANKLKKNIFERSVPLEEAESFEEEREEEVMKTEVKERSSKMTLDTTEMEETLAAAENKAKLVDLVPTPVMAIDRDFTITYMNNAGAAAVGKTPEGCIGQKCFNLFNTGHCNTPDCQVAKAMQQNGIFTNDT